MSPDNAKFSIVIVGGGGAGLAAAAAAAESGCKNIAVIEKHGAPGGSSAMASGIFAAESPAQKRQAIIARKEPLFQADDGMGAPVGRREYRPRFYRKVRRYRKLAGR